MEVDGNGAESTEWEYEYEYDDNETEDVYFTLDLGTPHQSTLPLGKTPKAKPKSGTPHVENTPIPSTPLVAATPGSDQGRRKSDTPSTNESAGRLQVLDLHTDNPLILFNNALYSCHWITTLGSQFYIASSGAVKPALRSGYVLDVVGLSSAKLIGKPAVLRPKSELSAGTSAQTAISIEETLTSGSDVNMTTDSPDDVPSLEPLTAQQRLAALQRTTTNPEIKAKASFLERLSRIKQQRGETDTVPFEKVKGYEVSEAEKDEIRKRARAAEGKLSMIPTPAKVTKKPTKPHVYVRGPYKKRAKNVMDVVSESAPKRKKPGPKSGKEVREALGLGNGVGVGPALQPPPLMPGFMGNGIGPGPALNPPPLMPRFLMAPPVAEYGMTQSANSVPAPGGSAGNTMPPVPSIPQQNNGMIHGVDGVRPAGND